MSSNQFFVDGGGHTRLMFLGDDAGKSMDLVLNPGPLADHRSADQPTGDGKEDAKPDHSCFIALHRSVRLSSETHRAQHWRRGSLGPEGDTGILVAPTPWHVRAAGG